MLKIDTGVKIFLYAPTYRDLYNNDTIKEIAEYGFEQLDVDNVLSQFERTFGGKHIMLYRAHHNMIPTNVSTNTINVSDYPDMQELLVAADYLITDYSSSMVDYSLQKKLGFLYVPDLSKFEWNIPKFNPISNWPYPYALKLIELISLYNEYNMNSKIDKFHKMIGTREQRMKTYVIYY